MNIGIDARSLIEKKVGFGYFLENTLKMMANQNKEDIFYLFSDRPIVSECINYDNVVQVLYSEGILLKKTFFFYWGLSSYIKKKEIKLDVFWGTMHMMPKGLSNNMKKIVTIHDFTHLKFPESTTKYNLLISKLFFGKSLVNSDEVVCISNNTREELLQYFPQETKGKNVCVIYEGGYGEPQQIVGAEVSEKVSVILDKPYVLFVGTIEPRKNIRLLIEAAPKLVNVAKVVICGKIGWEKQEIVEKLRATDNLVYLDYITDAEKKALMSKAICQVQPSLYEGFGLPVVESMQAGGVALVANNSSLAELVEIPELKFETENVDDFVDKVNKLVESPKMYQYAKEYCLKRGTFFDWKRTAAEYLKLMK